MAHYGRPSIQGLPEYVRVNILSKVHRFQELIHFQVASKKYFDTVFRYQDEIYISVLHNEIGPYLPLATVLYEAKLQMGDLNPDKSPTLESMQSFLVRLEAYKSGNSPNEFKLPFHHRKEDLDSIISTKAKKTELAPSVAKSNCIRSIAKDLYEIQESAVHYTYDVLKMLGYGLLGSNTQTIFSDEDLPIPPSDDELMGFVSLFYKLWIYLLLNRRGIPKKSNDGAPALLKRLKVEERVQVLEIVLVTAEEYAGLKCIAKYIFSNFAQNALWACKKFPSDAYLKWLKKQGDNICFQCFTEAFLYRHGIKKTIELGKNFKERTKDRKFKDKMEKCVKNMQYEVLWAVFINLEGRILKRQCPFIPQPYQRIYTKKFAVYSNDMPYYALSGKNSDSVSSSYALGFEEWRQLLWGLRLPNWTRQWVDITQEETVVDPYDELLEMIHHTPEAPPSEVTYIESQNDAQDTTTSLIEQCKAAADVTEETDWMENVPKAVKKKKKKRKGKQKESTRIINEKGEIEVNKTEQEEAGKADSQNISNAQRSQSGEKEEETDPPVQIVATETSSSREPSHSCSNNTNTSAEDEKKNEDEEEKEEEEKETEEKEGEEEVEEVEGDGEEKVATESAPSSPALKPGHLPTNFNADFDDGVWDTVIAPKNRKKKDEGAGEQEPKSLRKPSSSMVGKVQRSTSEGNEPSTISRIRLPTPVPKSVVHSLPEGVASSEALHITLNFKEYPDLDAQIPQPTKAGLSKYRRDILPTPNFESLGQKNQEQIQESIGLKMSAGDFIKLGERAEVPEDVEIKVEIKDDTKTEANANKETSAENGVVTQKTSKRVPVLRITEANAKEVQQVDSNAEEPSTKPNELSEVGVVESEDHKSTKTEDSNANDDRPQGISEVQRTIEHANSSKNIATPIFAASTLDQGQHRGRGRGSATRGGNVGRGRTSSSRGRRIQSSNRGRRGSFSITNITNREPQTKADSEKVPEQINTSKEADVKRYQILKRPAIGDGDGATNSIDAVISGSAQSLPVEVKKSHPQPQTTQRSNLNDKPKPTGFSYADKLKSKPASLEENIEQSFASPQLQSIKEPKLKQLLHDRQNEGSELLSGPKIAGNEGKAVSNLDIQKDSIKVTADSRREGSKEQDKQSQEAHRITNFYQQWSPKKPTKSQAAKSNGSAPIAQKITQHYEQQNQILPPKPLLTKDKRKTSLSQKSYSKSKKVTWADLEPETTKPQLHQTWQTQEAQEVQHDTILQLPMPQTSSSKDISKPFKKVDLQDACKLPSRVENLRLETELRILRHIRQRMHGNSIQKRLFGVQNQEQPVLRQPQSQMQQAEALNLASYRAGLDYDSDPGEPYEHDRASIIMSYFFEHDWPEYESDPGKPPVRSIRKCTISEKKRRIPKNEHEKESRKGEAEPIKPFKFDKVRSCPVQHWQLWRMWPEVSSPSVVEEYIWF